MGLVTLVVDGLLLLFLIGITSVLLAAALYALYLLVVCGMFIVCLCLVPAYFVWDRFSAWRRRKAFSRRNANSLRM